MQESMRFVLCYAACLRFILVHQACMIELLFMFADQCLYVNKSLNAACLSYKVIVSLQNIWNKLLNPYILVLLFMKVLVA